MGSDSAFAPARDAHPLEQEALADLVRAIDAVLPQTQCGQCGYGGCLPYARALAQAQAPIDRCPPGGEPGVGELARLLGRPVVALDPACGAPRPLHVARIDERRCIGCTICIRACPVDAIVGAMKRMHTVVAADCTGCDLCLAPCPMDCIQMVPVRPARAWTREDADRARRHMQVRDARLQREEHDRTVRLAAPAPVRDGPDGKQGAQESEYPREAPVARGHTIVEQALEQVRRRRAAEAAGAAIQAPGPGVPAGAPGGGVRA